MDFQEQQKELCHLSSFISDQEQWLDSVLGRLEWSRDGLGSHVDGLQRCPYDPKHYVPGSSLETHKVKCWYGTRGVKVDTDTVQILTSRNTFYGEGSTIPHVHIDHATEEGVVSMADQLCVESEKSLSRDNSRSSLTAVSRWSESLEDVRSTPVELMTLPPQQIISYIKSWKKIPSDFISLQTSAIDVTRVKGWLFQNLPNKHSHSTSLGGEMVAVETIMKCLTAPGSGSTSPDAIVSNLKPILGARSRTFVLDLWKYVHISKLQSEHGIQDSFVEDIVPLTAAVLLNRSEKEAEEEPPLISERVKELLLMSGAGEENGSGKDEETFLPLPMDHVFYKFTTNERRALYDYAVELTSGVPGSLAKLKELDPDLVRDDEAALKAKLKGQGASAVSDGEEEGGNVLEQLKRKRDYRRRRQAYRARNVHITKRTPKEIFRDIINSRMEEIAAAAATNEVESKGHTLPDDVSNEEHRQTEAMADDSISGGMEILGSPHRERARAKKEEHARDKDRSEKPRKRKDRHRSRSRSSSASRSRSRERHHKRSKKHKKHKSRSRSRSNDRSSKNRKRL